MDKKMLVSQLRNSNLMSASVATEIADKFEEKVLAKNQFLLTEGKVSDARIRA